MARVVKRLRLRPLEVHWLLLIDMTIFSTQLSAFLLVVGHVLGEVKQFLTALTFLLLLFGSVLVEKR